MDHLKIHIFSLNQEEEEERRSKGITTYYWLYLKAIEKGWDLYNIKEFILERIKKRIKESIFSNKEIWALAAAIAGKTRRYVKNYLDGKVVDIQESEKKFKSELFTLFQKFLEEKDNERKGGIKKARKAFSLILRDKDNQEIELKPMLVFSVYAKKDAKKDQDCQYFKECYDLSKKNNARLDCRYCPHQNVIN